MASPRVVVVDGENDHWKVELRDVAALRDALGAETFNAFCRCFVHSDRLLGLVSSSKASMATYSHDAPAYMRNLHTSVWFAVGTFRELALAIRDLRASLARRGKLDTTTAPWVRLIDVEKRWNDDPFFKKTRDVAAFHVDPPVMEKGILAILTGGTVTLAESIGPTAEQFSLSLGRDALIQGLDKDAADFERFIRQVSEDHDIALTIQDAFVEALDAVGIPQARE